MVQRITASHGGVAPHQSIRIQKPSLPAWIGGSRRRRAHELIHDQQAEDKRQAVRELLRTTGAAELLASSGYDP
jgi:hypothetical protein